MLSLKNNIATVAAALLATVASPAAANPYPCFYPGEEQSARIHDFQILMMVGALKCRDLAPGSVGSYGAMLSDRDQEMAAHGDRLLSRMIDEYGYRDGRRAFDTYETTLSNEHAQRPLSPEACADLGTYARMAHEATPAELETLAGLASRREIALCGAAVPAGAVRTIPSRARPLAAPYPRPGTVRVIRGAVPPQVAAAQVRSARAVAVPEFPDMVSAPIAQPQIEEEAALAAEAAASAALASRVASRIAAAATQTQAAPPTAEEPAPAKPAASSLDEAITALDNAAKALRDLREDQGGE